MALMGKVGMGSLMPSMLENLTAEGGAQEPEGGLMQIVRALTMPAARPAPRPALPTTPEAGREHTRLAIAQAMGAPAGSQIQDQLAGLRRLWEG